MTDFGPGVERTAKALAGLATKASYVTHDRSGRPWIPKSTGAPPRDHAPSREQMAKRAKEFDVTVTQVIEALDSRLEPVFKRLPQPVQAAVQQAREARRQAADTCVSNLLGTGEAPAPVFDDIRQTGWW